MEEEILALERQFVGSDARLEGNIRVSAAEGPVSTFLPPLLAEFRRGNPAVTLELVSEFGPSDLNRREADVALRVTKSPPDDSLGRYVCDFAVCLYTSDEYLARSGTCALHEYDWVLFEPAAKWLVPKLFPSEEALRKQTVFSTNRVVAATLAAREGQGILAMSAFLADCQSGLTRMGGPISELTMEMWILTQSDLRTSARVTALMDFLARRLRKDKAKFEATPLHL